jgi:hypothetical protein
MKCYQYDNRGYYLFTTDDYGQGLPRNATYIKPLAEKEGYLVKFSGESWGYEMAEAQEEPNVIDQQPATKEQLKESLKQWYREELYKIMEKKTLVDLQIDDSSLIDLDLLGSVGIDIGSGEDPLKDIKAELEDLNSEYQSKLAEIEKMSD